MEAGPLVRALEQELSVALSLVDGFLGHLNVEHEITSTDLKTISAKIQSIQLRYGQLLRLYLHKYSEDKKKKDE